MSDTTNEPAFPQDRDEQGRIPQDWGVGGLTVRDYFAAKALGGMMGNITLPNERRGMAGNEREMATLSYEIADAMMEARKL